MRVLIAGGNQMKNFAPRYYDYANKLANGFTRDNHTVLRYLDRDASRLSNVFRMRKLGIGAANNKFLRHVDIFQPDLIIFIHADVIRTGTLRELRNSHPDIKLAQVGVDPLFMPGQRPAAEFQKLPDGRHFRDHRRRRPEKKFLADGRPITFPTSPIPAWKQAAPSMRTATST